ncbi:MAG TPA: HlyC/CorC family transporter, partial [Flexistipes sinusarabici]|nr:HlyC/CorC family transporter [Flexistipes sinusarabici]
LHNIFEISDTIAREVMVPRTDMTILKVDQPINDIINVVSQTEYSRIPVYENRMDNIIGILYVKDLLKYIKEDFASIDIRKIMRKVYFVPETKKIDDLLREFQLNRIHLAVVVDEYGGVSGIVTLEDILEEIVGEIRDEYDKEDDDIVEKSSESEYIVRARMDVDDFCDFFGLEKSEDMDEYETLGGLIYDLAGKIPDVGDEFNLDGYTLTVIEKESRKLKKIKVVRNEVNENSEDERYE